MPATVYLNSFLAVADCTPEKNQIFMQPFIIHIYTRKSIKNISSEQLRQYTLRTKKYLKMGHASTHNCFSQSSHQVVVWYTYHICEQTSP